MNDRLNDAEKAELAEYVERLNALKVKGDDAIDRKDRKAAWAYHDESVKEYAKLAAFKRAVRARLARLPA